jgi:hypothetical protein
VSSVLCRKSNNEIRSVVGGNLASYSKAHEFKSRSGCQLKWMGFLPQSIQTNDRTVQVKPQTNPFINLANHY